MHMSFPRRHLLVLALIATVAGCASTPDPVSISDTAARTPNLSTLSALIAKAGLTEALKTDGPYTVFAPSDEAFKKVPSKTLEEISASPERLKAVLTYHVVPGKLQAADVKNSSVKTLQGANVALSKAGTFVTIEDAMVTTADVAATNGVIHVIDTVLIPPAPARR